MTASRDLEVKTRSCLARYRVGVAGRARDQLAAIAARILISWRVARSASSRLVAQLARFAASWRAAVAVAVLSAWHSVRTARASSAARLVTVAAGLSLLLAVVALRAGALGPLTPLVLALAGILIVVGFAGLVDDIAKAVRGTFRDVNRSHDDIELAERTYFRYRDARVPLIDSPGLVDHLEKRYRRQALRLWGRPFPVTVTWKNDAGVADPDSILGELDSTEPGHLLRAPHLPPKDYSRAREFIKAKYKAGPIKWDGIDYCMKRIDVTAGKARVDGEFGYYYDNILTQYAMEWELKKALGALRKPDFDALFQPGSLPLREAIEACGDPILRGAGRCAAITVSTLLVFKRRGQYWCLIHRRSRDVGVSPGMLHVVPAGMFEADNLQESWSVVATIWRELLEEIYDEKEQMGADRPLIRDLVRHEPISTLIKLMDGGHAALTVTGIACDLLNLRPEICTALVVDSPAFAEARQMNLNWEYELQEKTGIFATPWPLVDDVISKQAAEFGTVSAFPACLALGTEWVHRTYRI